MAVFYIFFLLNKYIIIIIKYTAFSGCDDIDRSLYNSSLLHDTCEEGADDKTSWSLRMYHLTSLTGEFTALPVIPYRYHPDLPTAYPYRQEQLYDVSQPGLYSCVVFSDTQFSIFFFFFI